MGKIWIWFKRLWKDFFFVRKRGKGGKVQKEEIQLAGFVEQAKDFCGLYEALYTACHAKKQTYCHDVIMEWRIRLLQITEKPFSRTLLKQIENAEENNNYIECATWFLERIFQTGIVRDERKTIILDELDLLRYGAIDGRKLIPGEHAAVLCPCWYYGDYLLERGVLS